MYEYIAVVRSVHDGDTFRADVDLGFGVWTSNQAFRLYGIQAWELGDPRGKPARDELRKLIPVGSEILIKTRKDAREKYGRMLATVLAPVGDVADELVAGGHGVYWDGHGPRPVSVPPMIPRQLTYPERIYSLDVTAEKQSEWDLAAKSQPEPDAV